MTKDKVIDFIGRFLENQPHGEVVATFTGGCCYWYAKILQLRFDNEAIIMYDEVANHFGTMIGDRIYDITGDVTEKYSWVSWASMSSDNQHYQRIVRDCVNF